jgi:hypothetical protein
MQLPFDGYENYASNAGKYEYLINEQLKLKKLFFTSRFRLQPVLTSFHLFHGLPQSQYPVGLYFRTCFGILSSGILFE